MNITVFNEAQEAYRAGDYKRALGGFTVCTRDLNNIDPADLAKFYHLIGNCYIKIGNAPSAVEYYDKALAVADEQRRPSLCVNLGTALLGVGDYARAVDAFDQALSYDDYPTPYKAYSGKGAAQLKLGNVVEAGAAYREAALDRSNPAPARALVNLGVCFMELKRPGDAVASYETALEFDLDPLARDKALANLGQAYMAQGRVNKAIEAFEDAEADGGYELSSMARHDYDLARTLKEHLENKVPGLLSTGVLDRVVLQPMNEREADGDFDPFAPSTPDPDEAVGLAEPVDLEEADVDDEPADAPDEVSGEQSSPVDGGDGPVGADGAAGSSDAADVPAGDAEPAELDAADGVSDEEADAASAETTVLPALEPDSSLDIATSVIAPVDADADDQPADDVETSAIPVISPDGASPLPSPEDSGFFEATEQQIVAEAQEERRKSRKARGAGLKAAIVIVVILILLAAAVCAAYVLGYGYPTQEQVGREFVSAVQSEQTTDQYWSDSVDQGTREAQMSSLSGLKSYDVVAVERNMSQSDVYVKAQTEEGGEVYYQLVMGRKGISWGVEYVELYFPSKQ